MNLLLLTNHLDIGGIETNLVRLTATLTARGHRCLIGARPGALSHEARAAGGELIELAMTPSRPASFAADAARLRHLLLNDRPDAVHVFSATAAVTAWLPLRLVGHRPPVVASVMGLAQSPDESPATVRRRVRLTIAGADRVVVMAPAIAEVVRSLGRVRRRVVHDTVVGVEPMARPDPAVQRSIRESLGLDAETEVVTTIGRLDPRKSHELFVRAAALVAARRPKAHFLLVGDGPMIRAIRAEVDRLDMGGRIHLLGTRRDIADLLAVTDVYVRPGMVEGFIGITVLEAQAMAVPTVSFTTRDVKLAIEDGVSGLLARNGDPGDLARQICGLLTDPVLAARIGAGGHERFVRTYALTGVVDRLEALYRSLANHPTPDAA